MSKEEKNYLQTLELCLDRRKKQFSQRKYEHRELEYAFPIYASVAQECFKMVILRNYTQG